MGNKMGLEFAGWKTIDYTFGPPSLAMETFEGFKGSRPKTMAFCSAPFQAFSGLSGFIWCASLDFSGEKSPHISHMEHRNIIFSQRKGICDRFLKNVAKSTLPETNSSPIKIDGWNTFSFPLGAFRPIFRGVFC